jgi:hypothetical protein
MASCSDSGMLPATTFIGTLPENGFVPFPAGRLWPEVSETAVE